MTRNYDMEALGDIGERLTAVFIVLKAAIEAAELTPDEIGAFTDYLNRQESVGAIFNPTFYARQDGFKMLEQVKAQVAAVQLVANTPAGPHGDNITLVTALLRGYIGKSRFKQVRGDD